MKTLNETFSTAKTITLQTTKYDKFILFYEIVPKINLLNYLRTFKIRDFALAVGVDYDTIRSAGIRFIITKDQNNFIIFLWNGERLHESICMLLDDIKDKHAIPKLNYTQRYHNSSRILPAKLVAPLFPGIWFQEEIATNMMDAALESWEDFFNSMNVDYQSLLT